jgi:alpha-L-fucosidase
VGPDDVRFTARNRDVYVIQLGVPTQALRVKSMGLGARLLTAPIENVALLGSDEKLDWKQNEDALSIAPPKTTPASEALVYKVSFRT